jgi:hypothetical protein
MRRLKRGDVVRVRLVGDGDSDWCVGWVALASNTDPASAIFLLNGMVRTRTGEIIGGVLPVTVDYTAEKVTAALMDDSEYAVEVNEQQYLPFLTYPVQ